MTRSELESWAERLHQGIVLDKLFSRWHDYQLKKLLHKRKEGLSNDVEIIGYVSTLPEGTDGAKPHASFESLWSFVTGDMYEVIMQKWGNVKGHELYQELFGFMFDPKDLAQDGLLNEDLLISWRARLDYALERIEQAYFIKSPQQIEDFIMELKSKNTEIMTAVEEALGNEEFAILSNGRHVNRNTVADLKWKDRAYDEALKRLHNFRKRLIDIFQQVSLNYLQTDDKLNSDPVD